MIKHGSITQIFSTGIFIIWCEEDDTAYRYSISKLDSDVLPIKLEIGEELSFRLIDGKVAEIMHYEHEDAMIA